MSWPRVKLSDVATINPRLPRDVDESQQVTFVAMASASEDGHLLASEARVLSETKKGFTYFDRSDVLLAKITPCFENGKCLRPGQIPTEIGFGSTEFHVIRPDTESLDSLYLFYLVWSEQFRFLGEKSMSGAAGQKRVGSDFLKGFEIPLPPLPEQKRIAAILDKADAIRRKRQQAIQLADDFLRAVFLDMFGDPNSNPKSVDVLPMTEVFDIKTGKLNSNAAIEGGKYPFFTCAKEVFAIDEYAFDQEALLLAGNNAQADYDVKHYKGRFNAYQRTYVLTLRDSTWSYPFYKFALQYQLSSLKYASKGSSTKYITMEIMGRTMLPVPSQEDQKIFVDHFERVGNVQAALLVQAQNDENLFSALSNRVFSGQL